jgi:hypothetical protein
VTFLIWMCGAFVPTLTSVRSNAFKCLMLLSVLTVCGCGSKQSAEPEFVAPGSSSTTVVDNEWAVPEKIDATYAQRVIQELTDIEGEIRRDVFDNHRFTDESRKKVEAIYAEPLLGLQLKSISEHSMKEHPDLKANPPSRQILVTQISSSNSSCMYVFGTLSDPARKIGIETHEAAWGLRTDVAISKSLNPTGWRFVEEIPKTATGGDPCGKS